MCRLWPFDTRGAVTWQEALRQDTEAREGFTGLLGKLLLGAAEDVERQVKSGNLQGAACAVGKKDAITEIYAAFEAEERERTAHAEYERAAGIDHRNTH